MLQYFSIEAGCRPVSSDVWRPHLFVGGLSLATALREDGDRPVGRTAHKNICLTAKSSVSTRLQISACWRTLELFKPHKATHYFCDSHVKCCFQLDYFFEAFGRVSFVESLLCARESLDPFYEYSRAVINNLYVG